MWKVVPLCDAQLKDVRNEDILENGDFRKCNTYRGGGGYDKFPAILKKRLGYDYYEQFIVQLYGCNLECPYCYVTESGIWGKYKLYDTNTLLSTFRNNDLKIFHLMGGAPGLYLSNWKEIITNLKEDEIFHSDLLLNEKPYDLKELKEITQKNVLIAVNIKGTDKDNYEMNTNVKYNEKLIFENLDKVVKSGLNFYITFTNPNKETYTDFVNKLKSEYGENIMNDSFVIDLIDYEALK